MAYRRLALSKIFFCFLPFLFFSALISGCGGSASDGGPGDSSNSLPTKTLQWNPPNTYVDGTPLDPQNDLDSFEIFVNNTGDFLDSDLPMVAVAAREPGNPNTVTTFNLANLAPQITEGVVYYVSVRSVLKNGVKSSFSSAISFSF